MATTKYKLDQVAVRLVRERPLLSEEAVNSPDAAVRVMNKLLKDYDREVFAVVNLQSDLKPINMNIVSIGTLSASLTHPREILKPVVLSNAAAVLLVHNHPSGRMEPSEEDLAITKRMRELFGLMDVSFIDHVILGSNDRYYSFSEREIMPMTSNRDWTMVGEASAKPQRKHGYER